MRNEGNNLLESVEEAIRVGEENGVRVEISHHKAAGKANWGRVNVTLRMMEQARKEGVEINCDVYPYTAGSTTITALLPVWAQEGGVERMLERLQNSEARASMKRGFVEDTMEGENLIKAAGWDGILIGECPSSKKYEGKSLEQILRDKNALGDPYAGFFDWLVEVGGHSTMILFHMDESDVKTVMSSPLSSIVSDAWVTAPGAGGKPHPRVYGTFPRLLGKYVREERALSLEDAVRKVTSMPAGKLGLADRGLVKEGFWADIVVFDPDKVIDRATYDDPHQYPEGISCVIVNGQVVVERGTLTGARPGRVLRRG
jgi:N-acyl-D-amino-acid deacylase